MSREPVFRQVLANAAQAGERAAIVHEAGTLTYAALAGALRNRAAVLERRFGVSRGDRVAVLAEPTPEFLATWLAVHSLGAACAPLDAHAPPERLARIAARLAPKVVISGEPLPPDIPEQARFADLSVPAPDAPPASAAVAPEDVAEILLTTGTTADAKAVMLSHRATAAAVRHINAVVGTARDDVEVLALPLHHSFGLGRARCVLASGATLVLVRGFMDGAQLIETLLARRATGFASVPAGIAILLACDGGRLAPLGRHLRYLELGSAAMPEEQKRALMRLLPETRICMHYGLTEASRSAFLCLHEDRGRLESIGRPSPGVEMRVAAPPGEVGEIEIRGEHLMSGYWQAPGLTAERLRDGWLRSGDLGRMDANGYFFLEARVDEVINVGGRKVLPREIEEVLLGHPAIAECACLGVPDPQGPAGEMVCVWLVARERQAPLPAFGELAKLLRQTLEPYKIPRQFRWIDALPTSASGKVQKHHLRELP